MYCWLVNLTLNTLLPISFTFILGLSLTLIVIVLSTNPPLWSHLLIEQNLPQLTCVLVDYRQCFANPI